MVLLVLVVVVKFMNVVLVGMVLYIRVCFMLVFEVFLLMMV